MPTIIKGRIFTSELKQQTKSNIMNSQHYNLDDATEQVANYFEEYEVSADNLDLKPFFDHCEEEEITLSEDDLVTLLCNLEDTELMQEIVDGNYETFDPWNESLFNDAYWDISEMLDLHGESERDEEDGGFENGQRFPGDNEI